TYLQGLDNCTLLDLPKPLTAEVAPAVHSQVLYADLPHLQALAQQHDLTVHCLLIATWALVLRVYTGQGDVVFGNTVSGRAVDVAHVDRLVGCLVNVVPFRTRITPGQSVLNLLQSIRDDLVAMVTYEHCHLSEVQQWTALDHPIVSLFNTLLAFESFPFDVDASTTPGVKLHSLDMQGQDDYDCTVAVEPHGTELHLTLTWNASRFDATYAKLLASNVQSCLAIAQGLVGQGVSPEEPTGMLVQRVPATIAALFGVLLAGAAFVPIDPTYPMDRIAYILKDCGIKHALYHAEDAAVAAAMLALTFDCSLGDIFLSLCHGATLVLSGEITELLG
ncbi:hypothetical protein H4R35_001027, partial [Dimargaris xerosporica]